MTTVEQLVVVGRLDHSEQREVYLCEVGGQRYVRISKDAYGLHRAVQDGMTFEQIAEAMVGANGAAVSAHDVETAYAVVAAKLSDIGKSKRLSSGFWLRLRVVPARAVERLVCHLGFLFTPAWFVVVLALLAVATAVAARNDLLVGVTTQQFWPAYLLFLGSLLAHELGHAAACARYGAAPGEIGVTMYLMYPAFYSDVSAAWRLRRWQRVVVDAGGTYLQLVAAAAMVLIHAATAWEPFRLAVVFILGSCLVSLNPILKFDGYWMIADALGVTNLAGVRGRVLHRVWATLRGKTGSQLPWRPAVTLTLVVYVAITVAFWGYFLWFIVTGLEAVVRGYPALLVGIGESVVAGRWPSGQAAQSFLATTFMLIFVLILLRRMIGLATSIGLTIWRRYAST